jgi:hypothetical protein
MRKKLCTGIILLLLLFSDRAGAQTLPGDSLVFGPMFSVVYGDSVRVWVVTKDSTGSGNTLSLELSPTLGGSAISGSVYNNDSRLGYHLRSYLFTNLAPGLNYTAKILANDTTVLRSSIVKNNASVISDFEFLAGGCGRIYDTTRCIDIPESMTHTNGTPDIYKYMASENSDMMVWTGDATYLLGLEHTMGVSCPGAVNDWANMDALFARYAFYRGFHDSLTRAMPQLAIPDNHDLGGNEFNKNMPTLGIAKDNFKNWWPNPVYKSNPDGSGLYSSYRYKDVEFFLLDNRSYRESTTRHLGTHQLAWLKTALLNSTAPFKVLISGTPSFNKGWGGRNFSITAECDTLLKFIKSNNIDGVLCYSADIHGQQFYGKYNDHTYPFFDVLSGNLASDVDLTAATSITPDNDATFWSNAQTYLRTNLYGNPGDRRYKVEYVSPQGVVYYGAIIHEDMLKSVDDSTKKLSLSYMNGLTDSSKYNRILTASGVTYETDKDGNALSAIAFDGNASLTVPQAVELDMHDRTFSITYWVKPTQFSGSGYSAVFSNSNGNNGYSIGFDYQGHPIFINHANNISYVSTIKMKTDKWGHVTWKYDNIKLQLFLYLNGQLVQKWTGVTTPVASTGALLLGTNYQNKSFDGLLDEFNIYGKLITDKTIQVQSGYVPHRGSAINLGGSQNMFIPSAQINPVFSNAFTVEFWSRFTSSSISGPIVSAHGRVNNQTTGWDIEFTNNKPNLVFGNNSTTGWLKIVEAGYAWQSGEWNHVAVTAIPNDSLYFYVNGEKVGTAKYTAYYTNNFGFGLGKSAAYGSTAQIEMDELRIWNTPLNKDSINKRMHYKLSGNESNLAFYYDFNPHTDTSIISAGSNNFALTLNNAQLVSSLAPVTAIDPVYRSTISGNWSIRKRSNKGLSLEDPITIRNNSMIVGHKDDSLTAPVSVGSTVHYLKGGWQIDGLNIPVANLKINLNDCLPGYDSISKHLASEYYLLKADDGNMDIINTGYFDGTNLVFMNTFVDTGVYYLGWKADSSAQLFDRGGALSLLEGHNVTVPSAAVNNALSGDGLTVELWARLMQDPGTNTKLLGKSSSNSGNKGFEFEFLSNNAIQAIFGNNASSWNTISSSTPWNIGEWNHVAITAAPNDSFKLYLNGRLVGKNPFVAYYPNTYDLAFGKNLFNQSPTVAILDEVRIWNKVKSQDEILRQMHLSLPSGDTSLKFNYTFNQQDNGYIINQGSVVDSVIKTNAKIIPATAPVGNINTGQQHRVAANWSLRDSTNGGLSIMVSIPDYETNVVIGKDSLSGNDSLLPIPYAVKLKKLWQLDPLKVESGAFDFDGPATFGNDWAAIKNDALEFYLLKMDTAGNMAIQAVGTEENDKINFANINIGYGMYTLGWMTSDGVILPITWGYVRASVKDATANLVEWQTIRENNARHFEIERSEDGNTFSAIGRVSATGNSLKPINYNYVDESSVVSKLNACYYRILQTDIDGKSSYSSIVRVARNGQQDAFDVSVTPNPGASEDMYLSVSANGKFSLQLSDATGKILMQREKQLDNSPVKFLPKLPAGSYYLTVSSEHKSTTKKIVVR